MDVDEARRDEPPFRVELTSATFGHLANGDDSVAINADVRRDRFSAEPVDDETIADHKVMRHG